MTLAMLFWLLIILALVFNLWSGWPSEPGPRGFAPLGVSLFWFILFVILGIGVFGWPIRG